ncbi:hypothetical protein RJ641_017329 [Dillenia turbinata]|uniref:Uncharacterized protein n=1 Tax=Dillenia turbinata TaxID=194707 RepID=A0AAN8UXW2_9MAGN
MNRFLSYLSSEAYAAPKMYSAGELELGGSDKLYGLCNAQGIFRAVIVRNALTMHTLRVKVVDKQLGPNPVADLLKQ